MSYSDQQAQQEVNDILSSIRQMISEEEAITSPNTSSSSDPKLSSEPVLDLTQLVQEDGSVVQLSVTPQVSISDASRIEPLIEPLTPKFQEQTSTIASPDLLKASQPEPLHQEEMPALSSSYEAPSFSQPQPTEAPSLTPMPAPAPSENTFFPTRENSSSAPAPAEFLSQDTLQESAAAFAALARAAERRPFPENFPVPTAATVGEYTVDALMRDLLKPLLKEWLDAHLPSLVRSLVLEQIEKVLQQQTKPAP